MNIIHTITIKQVLTEKSKDSLMKKYENQKLQLSQECDQLQFEMKKIERAKKYPSQKLTQRFERELNERAEKIKLIEFQMDQMNILPIGSELKEKEVQGMMDIQVGDNWDEETLSKTIVIEDGKVKEIR
ncbi:YlqD family protein [Rossellomorea aquimaris]|uniref:YlqD family protein n=1 Tax=Rossellomorea aquimaris TaxID=189382 RepID=UPI0007D07393|nr:YlqD family protein [Rossellomorea aquimaris]